MTKTNKFIVFTCTVVALVIAIMALSHVFPGFGLWLEMNPTITILAIIAILGIFGYFLFREKRVVTTPPAASATGTPPAPTPSPARRSFPLSRWGIAAIVAYVGLVIWILVDDRIPDYIILHLTTLFLMARFLARPGLTFTAEMVRLFVGVGLLLLGVIAVFIKTINLDPEWLWGFITGGIPFLVMLLLVMTSTISLAGLRYTSVIVEATVCFAFVYLVAALLHAEIDDRLAYSLFLTPVLFGISPLFPSVSVTTAQRVWLVVLGLGLAILYTIIVFGLPKMNIPAPSGLTWKLVLLTVIFLGLTLLAEKYPRLNFVTRIIVLALLSVLMFPEVMVYIRRLFSWLPFLIALGLTVWVMTRDEIPMWAKYILSAFIFLFFCWDYFKDVVHWFQNQFNPIDLSSNGWWIGAILLAVAIGVLTWIAFKNRWLSLVLVVAALAVYVLATDREPSTSHGNSVGDSTSSPAGNSPAPTKKEPEGQSIWDKYPGKPVDDSSTIHE